MQRKQQIEHYLEGTLTERQRLQFEKTLHQNPALGKALAEEQQLRSAIVSNEKARLKATLEAMHQPAGKSRKTRLFATRLAASMALIAGLAIGYQLYQSSTNVNYNQLAQLHYQSPDWNSSRGPAYASWHEARRAFDAEDFAGSAAALSALLAAGEDSIVVLYHQAHVYVAEGKLDSARQAFAIVAGSASLLNELGRWNLALVLLQLGEVEAVRRMQQQYVFGTAGQLHQLSL